jgi:hypothetical protein
MAEEITAPGADGDVTHAVSDENYLKHGKGILSWLFTLDHKRIGVMYLVAILLSFFLGGVFALALRAELWTPGQTIMTADTYNKMFTLHGAVMIFLFRPSVTLCCRSCSAPRTSLCRASIWPAFGCG